MMDNSIIHNLTDDYGASFGLKWAGTASFAPVVFIFSPSGLDNWPAGYDLKLHYSKAQTWKHALELFSCLSLCPCLWILHPYSLQLCKECAVFFQISPLTIKIKLQ